MSRQLCQNGESGYIDWPLKNDFVFSFEIPLNQVKPLLPKGMHAMEIRPGVGLCLMALSHFREGCLGCLPEFSEPNLSIMVQNNLTRRDPSGEGRIPHFALYTLNITADNADFLRHAHSIDKMPIYQSQNLSVTLDGFSVKVKDDHGPIFDLCFSYDNVVDAQFEHNEYFVQIYTEIEGKLYYCSVIWIGRSFEHQKKDTQSRLYPHPFFQGLDVTEINHCYMQTIAAENSAVVRFYTPEVLR